jgi:hypothetical protein
MLIEQQPSFLASKTNYLAAIQSTDKSFGGLKNSKSPEDDRRELPQSQLKRNRRLL